MDILKGIFGSKESGSERTENPLEYVSIIQDLQRFRGSAQAEGDYYDFPNQIFFKILFHFKNTSDASSSGPSASPDLTSSSNTGDDGCGVGLLHPTWLEMTDSKATDQAKLEYLWNNNTAWSYLVLNGETARANNLQSFIEMLSNINSNTPWYFQNIKGLEQASNREVIGSEDFMMKPERNRITIECLEDSYDMRLSTLMDLYRSVVWSWEMKREMVPSNLRKFDMTIIAFQMPIKGLNAPRGSMKLSDTIMRNETKIVETNEGFAVIYDNGKLENGVKLTSYKAWEFHGCEFDYNSTKNSFESISNVEGTTIQPQIEILYDDCFEIRFNEFLGRHVTDLMGDANYTSTTDKCATSMINMSTEQPEVTPENISSYEDEDPGWLKQAVGGLMSWGKTKIKKIYLGNLNGLSISKIKQQIGELDDLGATVNAIKQYTRKPFNGNRNHKLSDIYPDPPKEQLRKLGNIYTAKTRANS